MDKRMKTVVANETRVYTVNDLRAFSAYSLLLKNPKSKKAMNELNAVYKSEDKAMFLAEYWKENATPNVMDNEEELDDLMGTLLFYAEEWDR